MTRATVWLPPLTGSLLIFYGDDTATANTLTMPTMESILEHTARMASGGQGSQLALLNELDVLPPLSLLTSSRYVKAAAGGHSHLDGFRNGVIADELPPVRVEHVVRVGGHKASVIQLVSHVHLPLVASLDKSGTCWVWLLGGISPKSPNYDMNIDMVGVSMPQYYTSRHDPTFRSDTGYATLTPMLCINKSSTLTAKYIAMVCQFIIYL